MMAQHLQGSFNDVADLLSFYGDVRGYVHPLTFDDPSDETLSNRILASYPQLVTKAFEISPLPPKVSSFVSQAMQITKGSWI